MMLDYSGDLFLIGIFHIFTNSNLKKKFLLEILCVFSYFCVKSWRSQTSMTVNIWPYPTLTVLPRSSLLQVSEGRAAQPSVRKMSCKLKLEPLYCQRLTAAFICYLYLNGHLGNLAAVLPSNWSRAGRNGETKIIIQRMGMCWQRWDQNVVLCKCHSVSVHISLWVLAHEWK